MPRRIYTYFPNQGFDLWNYVATWGSYLLGAAVLIFVANAILTSMKPADAPSNPWEAATLEWAVPSPPPAHNFDFEPVVYSRYPLWDIDVEDEHSASSSHAPSVVALATTTHAGEDAHTDDGHGGGHAIHLPAPTIYPMIFALGLNLLALAILFAPPALKLVFLAASAVYLVVAVIGWVREVMD